MKAIETTRLIANAELFNPGSPGRIADVLITDGVITSIGESATADETIDAEGCLLLPGLHDHHVHLAAYAASLTSINCGPPQVTNESELRDALQQEGSDWLRGTGFHESVLSDLNRDWLDRHGPARPVRIQHRSGRLWILNSLAMQQVDRAKAALPAHQQARLSADDGRLYDVDELLGDIWRNSPPPMDRASRNLARYGVTGINDMTPANDVQTWQWFQALQDRGDLLQRVRLSGTSSLTGDATSMLQPGETKIHLHDTSLPDFDELVEDMLASHRRSRPIAVHCVTEVELVYTLSAFRAAGTITGDRIEHASVVPPALLSQLKELGLWVVTQPNFIAERGDAYVDAIPAEEHAFLYRARSLFEAGIPTAFATDFPFGQPDPWEAIRAATERVTTNGTILGENETVSAADALTGFLGPLDAPHESRYLEPGAPADCCLMDVPWSSLQHDLRSSHVCMTLRGGSVIYSRD